MRQPVDPLFDAMKEFLNYCNWTALVAGPVSIEEVPGTRNKFRLVIPFLGGKRVAQLPAKTKNAAKRKKAKRGI